MNKIKKILSLALACLTTLSLAACNNPIANLVNKHEHTWEYFIAKEPTCTKEGILEKNCKDCGEKAYDTIAPSSHNYVAGVCTVCGAELNEEELNALPIVSMPEGANNSAKWTLDDIYEKTVSFGYIDTKQQFQYYLSLMYMQEISLNDLGMLNITLHFPNSQNTPIEVPISLVVGRVSVRDISGKTLPNIYRVSIFKENILQIVYTDGIQVEAGEIFAETKENYITGLGINKGNQLIVYYNNNKIAFAGNISENSTANNQAGFIYRENENGYTICGILNTAIEEFTVPLTHKGRPVNRIAYPTFHNLNKLKTVKVGENVKTIETHSFYNCPVLETVIIPANVHIEKYAFREKMGSTKIFLEGSRSDYTLGNNWNGGNQCYFAGEWRYVNGVPTAY